MKKVYYLEVVRNEETFDDDCDACSLNYDHCNEECGGGSGYIVEISQIGTIE